MKRERSVVKEAVTKVASTRRGTILVANQHTGTIILPRRGANGIALPPLRLVAGQVNHVDAQEWAERKKIEAVKHYLDRGLLAEVRREGKVPVLDSTSTDLQIPEHLQNEDQEQATQSGASAKVRKQRKTEISI